MGALTPEFVQDLQARVKLISAREYQRLTANMWWTKVAKQRPSEGRSERLVWLLDSARIEYTDPGSVNFEDILSRTTEIVSKFAGAGLNIKKELLEDLSSGVYGGEGLEIAANWARQMGMLAAYWPQKQIATAIRTNPLAYDGLDFFHAAHYVNPFKASIGTYANNITGAVLNAAGLGSAPAVIDDSVTVETAVKNIARVIAYAASIKMPNGEDPRGLRLIGLMHPPYLAARAQQVTNAKVIAQTAGSGGGGGDVEAVVRNFGLGQPIQADELGSSFSGGSDTSWYALMADAQQDELPAFLYVNREPFSIIAHNGTTSAELARTRELQWTTAGRNAVGTGHPYHLLRIPNA